jgi:hypothetical protein
MESDGTFRTGNDNEPYDKKMLKVETDHIQAIKTIERQVTDLRILLGMLS